MASNTVNAMALSFVTSVFFYNLQVTVFLTAQVIPDSLFFLDAKRAWSITTSTFGSQIKRSLSLAAIIAISTLLLSVAAETMPTLPFLAAEFVFS